MGRPSANVQDVIRFHGTAERALRATRDDFERVILRSDPGDHLGYLLGV